MGADFVAARFEGVADGDDSDAHAGCGLTLAVRVERDRVGVEDVEVEAASRVDRVAREEDLLSPGEPLEECERCE